MLNKIGHLFLLKALDYLSSANIRAYVNYFVIAPHILVAKKKNGLS